MDGVGETGNMDGSARPDSENVVGAVMVVGGGIAGMQASMDLAEAGYKVYLVEKNSAIGGHMAKLDKTFPTNDCAMCTISPRLVETGRHLDIEILTDSEVAEVAGTAGNLAARVVTRPRFVDVDKCTGCGKCAEVCPVPTPNRFDEGLRQQRAAHKLYPQAIPNAFAIDKRGVSPCRDACPAGQRAQGYIALIAEGRHDEALRTIKADNPFPAICGRICNARCEDACSRAKVDEAVNIRALKRFVTDTVYAEDRVAPEPVPRRFDERIAVIGAGPCGLTAAQDLCNAGYAVTVFEALPVAGGMLRVGVPEYRLPSVVVEREVQDILDLGVELRLNTPVDSLDDLFEEGFKAVLVAVGAHEGIRLPIPGNDLHGVLVNTRFLSDVRLAENPGAMVEGKRVLVLGGGNVAFDVARTAVRLGAQEVHMASLEGLDAMPAHAREISEAVEEGVHIHNDRTFVQVINDGHGGVGGVECQKVAGFSFNDGHLDVEIVPDSEHVLPADIVIFSVGQRAGLSFIPDDAGVNLTPNRTIAVNPSTYATDRAGVFAAGDSVSGTTFVIEAVAGGHHCADAIQRYLRGEPMESEPAATQPVAVIPQTDLDARILKGDLVPTPRVPVPEIDMEARKAGFGELELGYSAEDAQAEAARCLSCGICSECLTCSFECGFGAIDHEMVEKTRQIDVGAVVLAPGYQAYRAELSEEFGWGRYPNVVTSLEFERLLSPSGPNTGHVLRPSDGQKPKKVAFLQCVGSRDQSHDYCSAVCCMYAAKEAVVLVEHEPDTEVRVFMMDMRAFSKGYETYYRRAREKYGIQYTRCRVSAVKENPRNGNLIVRSMDRGEAEIREEEFDMVVLSVGMEISESVRKLGDRLGIELDQHGFCHTVQFDPLQTTRAGIYVAGPFREPKDIPESLVEASAAAASAGQLLASARGTLTREPEYPPERDVSGEDVRTAVFVCHCGTNIAGFLDVPGVAEYAKSLPGVVHSEDNLYACSQDNIAHIAEKVKELGANRVIVASCTPRTHEPLFQSSLRAAGLNPFLFDLANIRNQCSWVHSHDWDGATAKAKELVRMSAARTANLQALSTGRQSIVKGALVIGGGAAGMSAALSLAGQGFPVHLVERTEALGGNLRSLHFGIGESERPREILADLTARTEAHPLVTVHLETTLVKTGGFVGNFASTLEQEGGRFEVEHGVAILATGGVEYKGEEYGYGTDPRIVTLQEFEGKLAAGEAPRSVVMVLCVGPADQYCGRICCTSALKNAVALKRHDPEARVTVIYKDIRTYGFKERLYTEAREAGVLFVRYDDDRPPDVSIADGGLQVRVWEEILGNEMTLTPDALVLATPVVPSPTAHDLAKRLKVQLDMNGFFLEAHVKLRPVDFASDGFFMAGLAHYPKLLEESIIHAQAAAARAATTLAKDSLPTGGRVSVVDESLCVGCLTCVRSCPFGVPRVSADLTGVGGITGAARIEPAVCQGCGLCAAACPAGAIDLMHYTDRQVMAKVSALFETEAAE
jgi:heterodisulfide reductase subunit A-like polyferredoxin